MKVHVQTSYRERGARLHVVTCHISRQATACSHAIATSCSLVSSFYFAKLVGGSVLPNIDRVFVFITQTTLGVSLLSAY